MKKIISLALSVIMLATITAGLDFSAYATDNDVVSISVTLDKPIEKYEVADGMWENDENDNKYSHYGYTMFDVGTSIILNYNNGTSDTYKYCYDKQRDEEFFCNENGDKLDNDYLKDYDDQQENHWTVGTNYAVVEYLGVQTQVPVTIKKIDKQLLQDVSTTVDLDDKKYEAYIFTPQSSGDYIFEGNCYIEIEQYDNDNNVKGADYLVNDYSKIDYNDSYSFCSGDGMHIAQSSKSCFLEKDKKYVVTAHSNDSKDNSTATIYAKKVKNVSSVSVVGDANKGDYIVGQHYPLNDLELAVTYDDESTQTVKLADLTPSIAQYCTYYKYNNIVIECWDSISKMGDNTVEVYCNNVSTSFTATATKSVTDAKVTKTPDTWYFKNGEVELTLSDNTKLSFTSNGVVEKTYGTYYVGYGGAYDGVYLTDALGKTAFSVTIIDGKRLYGESEHPTCEDSVTQNMVDSIDKDGYGLMFVSADSVFGPICTYKMHNHSYNAVVETQPTCTQEGKTAYTCSICNESYTVNTAKTGHNFANNSKNCLTCGIENSNYVAPSPTPVPSAPTTVTTTAPTTTYKTPKITSVSKVTNGKKQFKVTYKKVSGVTGYQIDYSTSKKFTKKTTKSANVKGAKNTSKTFKKLKGGKKYYVRVRTYKTYKSNGKTTTKYSKYTSAKTVTTKK